MYYAGLFIASHTCMYFRQSHGGNFPAIVSFPTVFTFIALYAYRSLRTSSKLYLLPGLTCAVQLGLNSLPLSVHFLDIPGLSNSSAKVFYTKLLTAECSPLCDGLA